MMTSKIAEISRELSNAAFPLGVVITKILLTSTRHWMFTACFYISGEQTEKKHMPRGLNHGTKFDRFCQEFSVSRGWYHGDFQGCVLQIEDGWLIVTNWGFSRCMSIFCISYHIIFDRKFLMLLTSIFFLVGGCTLMRCNLEGENTTLKYEKVQDKSRQPLWELENKGYKPKW